MLAAYYQQMAPLKHLDSVLLYESSLSVVKDGRPTSTINASWPSAYLTFVSPADEVCQADLRMTGPSEYNILETHAYIAVYPIALLTLVAAPETAFALLNALTHLLLVVIPVLVLWRRVGAVAAAAFGVWVAVYPAWSLSAVGDYYMDRLYMAFALASLFGMDAIVNREERLHDTRWLAAWASVTVAAALFTERAAVMMIGVTVFFLALFPAVRRSTKAVVTLVGLAVTLTLYVYWYFDVVRVQGSGTGNLIANLDLHLLDTLQRPEAAAFLSVNVLLAGALVAFSGLRYLALTVCAMLPNLLISVGGAELNGWATHYHTMYIPFVIFAAAHRLWLSGLACTHRTLPNGRDRGRLPVRGRAQRRDKLNRVQRPTLWSFRGLT